MRIRQFILAGLLCALPVSFAQTSEPVVKGSFHSILILGPNCLTVPAAEPHLRPGSRLEMRECRNSADQIFEWNVVTFEIKYANLCVDAFRAGDGPSRPGDPVGLWYCQQTPHQKWYPDHKNEYWLDAFNIVGGGSPSSDLCMSIANQDKSIVGAQLTLQNCDGGHHQWLRLYSWPPLNGQALSQGSRPRPPAALPATKAVLSAAP